MKRNLKKVLLVMLFTTFSVLSISNVNALTIKETVNANDNYDTITDGTVVIGITKFEPNVVLTAMRISKATFNDVIFNYNTPGYNGVNIYYYLLGDWYALDDANAVSVLEESDPVVNKLNNSDIYYVNNNEKMLEITYLRELDEGYDFVFKTDNETKDEKVSVADGKLFLPATVKNVDVYIKNIVTKEEVIVDTFSKENTNDVEIKQVSKIDLSSTIEEKSNALIEKYYNKYKDKDVLTEVDDNVFYVTLGDYIGEENPTELTIGGVQYNKDPISLSIGMNAKTNVPVWKIKDGKVLVALTWLSADALPDKATEIKVGGQTFEVTVYDSSVKDNLVTLTGAKGLFGRSGYATKTEINGSTVDFYFTHRTSALGATLSVGSTEITDVNQIIFRKAPNNTMGITTPEDGVTYALYFGYANEAVSEEKDYTYNYKLAIPGKGVINLTLNGHAIPAKVDLSSTIEEKSNALIEKYYNKYKDKDILTEVDDNVFYVTLGDYIGEENPTELTIGGVQYNTDPLTLSIGNNAKTNVPVWKIKDGKVLVALTWLSADALPDKATEVKVGGQTFEVTVYDSSVKDNQLTLIDAGVVNKQVGYDSKVENIINNSLDFTYTHRATSLGIKLNLGDTPIVNTDQIIFRKAPDNKMGITTPESGYTYVVYLRYANEAVSEAKDYTYNYKLAIPGKGVISITFYAHEIVKNEQ